MVATETNVPPVQRLFDEGISIPSIPQLYYQIKKEVNDANSSIMRIGELVGTDPVLTGRLLMLANSPVFGFSKRIDTITEAVSLIGLQQVRELCLSSMVVEAFSQVTSQIIDLKEFWKHGLACGVSARVVAAYKGLPNIERFFVNGLMHDMGRLIMLTKIPAEMKSIFQDAKIRCEMVYRIERKKLKYDHCDAGALLMQLWELPDMTVDAVYYHHHPTQSANFALETSIIHVADVLCHGMQLGCSGETLVPLLNEKAWCLLGMKPTALASMMKDIDRQCTEIFRVMLH